MFMYRNCSSKFRKINNEHFLRLFHTLGYRCRMHQSLVIRNWRKFLLGILLNLTTCFMFVRFLEISSAHRNLNCMKGNEK